MRLPNVIAIEGIDASGKATQANMLADYLDSLVPEYSSISRPCLRKSFPAYDLPTGKLIASKLKGKWNVTSAAFLDADTGEVIGTHKQEPYLDALVLQALMVMNKYELADEIAKACVVERRSVVLDRYTVSGLAYGQADGLPVELLERTQSLLPKAHHVLIDIPVHESWARRPKREDKYEANKDRLLNARINYLAIFEKHGVDTSFWTFDEDKQRGLDPHVRTSLAGYYLVNGLGTPEEVHARIIRALEPTNEAQ